jgi:general secretion pathway protein F
MSQGLTLDHLVALNDEIAALVRVGLPLERGLRQAGSGVPGRLSALLTGLGERMSQGASLPEALAAEKTRVPPIYRAVVEAGMRAGRLPAALESLAAFVRAYLDSRRTIGLALCYPLIVLTVAYGLFVLLVWFVVPRFLTTFATFRIPVPAALRALGRLGETVTYWSPSLPILLLVLLVLWAWTGSSASFRTGRAWTLLRCFPWMGELLRQFEAANFADLLGLLVEQGVPYPEALILASEATGDTRLIRLGRELSEAVARGDSPRTALALGHARALPPLLRWMLATGQQQSALASSLHALAAIYRSRAEHQADKIRVFLPIVLLLVIGLSACLAFALSLFVPFAALLKDLALPLNA